MGDVSVDVVALDEVVALGRARLALEDQREQLSELLARVRAGCGDRGPVSSTVDRLGELLVQMERLENFAAVARDGVLEADRAAGGVEATEVIGALLTTTPSGRLWAYDAAMASIAVEAGISYEEAYLAVRVSQIDALDALIDRWSAGSPDAGAADTGGLAQLVADRDALVADLAGGDDNLAAAVIELLGRPGVGAADAVFDAPSLVYAGASINELLQAITGLAPPRWRCSTRSWLVWGWY